MKKNFLIFLFVIGFILLQTSSVIFAQDIKSSPSGLTGKTTRGTVELKWKAASDGIKRYWVKRSEDSSEFLTVLLVSGTRYVDSDVQTGKQYKYFVVACDANNKEAGKSNEITVNFEKSGKKIEETNKSSNDDTDKRSSKEKKSNAVTIPENLKAKYDSKEDCVLLTWDHQSEQKTKNFNIYRASSKEFENDTFKKIATLKKVSETEYKDTKVKKGETYYYNVEFFDGAKKSDKSKLISVQIIDVSASGDAFVTFAVSPESIQLLSVNFKDGSVQLAGYDTKNKTVSNWAAFGTVTNPPNYETGNVYVDSSRSDYELGSLYTLYCLNHKTKKLYISVKDGYGPWQEWRELKDTNYDISIPVTEDTKVSFAWSKKTHWEVAWNVKDGTVMVQAVNSHDGQPVGQWNPLAKNTVPPNYGPNSFAGAGASRENVFLFCYNLETSTLYFTSNRGAGRSWDAYQCVIDKSTPAPPNLK